MDGIGAIDPGLARDLAVAAACNPRSTWCIAVTDRAGTPSGTAVPGPPDDENGTDTTRRAEPGFALTPIGQVGGYGTWRLTTRQQDMLS